MFRSFARTPLTAMLTVAACSATSLVASPVAQAAPAPSAPSPSATSAPLPDLGSVVMGYSSLWRSSGKNDLHGTVLAAGPLQRNDQLASWINQHATSWQRFRALQNSAHMSGTSGYDQSLTIADGLGKQLGQIYVEGRLSGKLPLTTALLSNARGSLGVVAGSETLKKKAWYPRPFLPASPSAALMRGDATGCRPTIVNSPSLAKNRIGKPWADSRGNLKIMRVPGVTDRTHMYAKSDVRLDAGYGSTGLCAAGSYPSGHSAGAYQVALSLATLLPGSAPGILARASEAANNRIVLGVHYPLDVISGRMYAEATIATRWSDPTFRTTVIEPARRELVAYLTKSCTAKMKVKTLQACMAADTPYRNNPYWGAVVPGGTAQVVNNAKDAVRVYTERLSYGFAPTSSTRAPAAIPGRAANLLLTSFPTLTQAQRLSLIGQTQIASGHPLATGDGRGWQRVNLAAALSATVSVRPDGTLTVVRTGGLPTVLRSAK